MVTSSENLKLQFLATGGPAIFYLDSVSVTEAQELAVNDGMEQDDNWSDVGTPSVNVRSTDQVDSGTYSRHVTGNVGSGIQGEPWNLVGDRRYVISARVYPVSGTVKMQALDTATFDVFSAHTGDWETLEAHYTPGLDQNEVRLQFVAEGEAAANFYVDTVSIQEVRQLELNGDMEDSEGWTSLGTVTTNERRPHADTGDYEYRVVGNLNERIQSPSWDMAEGYDYVVLARVHLENGAVKLELVDSTNTVLKSVLLERSGHWETLRLIYSPEANLNGVKLRLVADENNTVFYADTVHIYKVTNLSRWQEFRYDIRGRVVEETAVNSADASVVQHIKRAYHSSGNGQGLLQRMEQYDIQQATNEYTEYTYDSAGRVIKTKQGSTTGDCCATLTEYDAAGQVISTTAIRDLNQAEDPVKSPVTHYRYDELGRRVATTTNAGTAFEQTTLTFYDVLDRVVRTITNYHPQGDSVPGDWVWNLEALPPRWERSSTDSTAVGHGDEQNQNIIADTEYNERGQVKLQRDVLGQVTLYGYDDAGRQIVTVQNASVPTYDSSYTSGDPDLSDYPAGNNPDQDIITTNEYDAVGNLVKAVDAAERVTFTVYDKLNRPEKVVRSAKALATIEYNPGDPAYDETNDPRSPAYSLSEEPDRDLIEWTRYDATDQVIETEQLLEMRDGQQSVVTRYVYDDLDRQVKTISNYVPQGTDPANWVWSNNQWEDGDGHAIEHDDNDQNLITETVYDNTGRVQYTRDVTGNRTWFVYDGLGRQVKTITNCSYNSGSPAPQDTSYVGALDDPAADIVSQTFYDANGRVQKTQRVLQTNEAVTDLEWLWTLQG